MDVQATLKGQYHAALAMLSQAIERCPESVWSSDSDPVPAWRIAYHTLFFTHLYLQANESAFQPWEHHREEYQFLSALPWPPHDQPKIGEAYTKEQTLEYWRLCDDMIDPGVNALDLDAEDCGFWWYQMPKLDHQLVNIRHIQHHVAQIEHRLILAGGQSVDWVGGNR
jgi:hypothetical protein